jgi:hypothetical protein
MVLDSFCCAIRRRHPKADTVTTLQRDVASDAIDVPGNRHSPDYFISLTQATLLLYLTINGQHHIEILGYCLCMKLPYYDRLGKALSSCTLCMFKHLEALLYDDALV